MAASLQESRQCVAGNARHFDAEEQHQQVIGTGHHQHSNNRTAKQRVEVGCIFLIGDPAENGECDHKHQKEQQKAAEEDREHVVHGQAGKQHRVGLVIDPQLPELEHHHHECTQAAQQSKPVSGNQLVTTGQTSEQHQDDGAAQDQFGQEQPQRATCRRLKRIASTEELHKQRLEIHDVPNRIQGPISPCCNSLKPRIISAKTNL